MGNCCQKQHLPDVDSTLTGDRTSIGLLILLDLLKPVELQ